jgi:hypothetical protein
MVERVLDCRDECAFRLWRLLPCTERALDDSLPNDAHLSSNGRLQVLLTKVDWCVTCTSIGEEEEEEERRRRRRRRREKDTNTPFLWGSKKS